MYQVGILFLYSNNLPLKPFTEKNKQKYKQKMLLHSFTTILETEDNNTGFKLYNTEKKISMKNLEHFLTTEFDFSQDEELISGRSYMSQIIMEEPNYLHNFTNLGYQSFFIAQEELNLMEKLYFESMRLGKVLDDITQTEPYFRDADIVGIDMKSLSWTATGTNVLGQPNGIDSRSICSLARYSGISDRVTSFGLFELPSSPIFHQLLSQIIWYFIEGYSNRFNEYPVSISEGFIKYIVTLSDRELVFYKSETSRRWWVELLNENYIDNKSKRTTLLPCTQEDYKAACDDELPERWWKASKRG